MDQVSLGRSAFQFAGHVFNGLVTGCLWCVQLLAMWVRVRNLSKSAKKGSKVVICPAESKISHVDVFQNVQKQ